MGKKNNIDFISDLQERSNHNVNHYFWINRVTPFTIAQWKTNKYFAPLTFIMYSVIGLGWVQSLNQSALEENKTFWSVIFDFHDATTSARFASVLLIFLLWAILGIGTVQTILQRIYAPPITAQHKPKKEKKKKYPKRPKNYK